MVNQSREKFFQKLSKRELQFLCRNLGIPFGQRKDLLANTLAALPEHYFDSKYRSSQATIGLSSLPQNSPVLGYNGGPVQSYANFARYSLGHNMPHNQFTEINSSALGVEAMNMESASTREEKYLNPEYDSAHAQSVPQCHQANFDSSGLHLPENTQSHSNFAGYVQAHKMPNDHFDKLHIAPSAAGIRKKREEYFLRLPKRQLISLCRKIQLPLTSTKCGLARNLAAMPECYFDPEYRVDFDATCLSSQRPSSKNDSSFISHFGESNAFNSQFKDITVCPLHEGTINVESVSKSKEVNAYQLSDTCCFQPVPQYSKSGFTNQEIADTSYRVVPPCDKDGVPDFTASNKSCSHHVQQYDGSAPNFDALPKAYDSATTTKTNSPSFEFHVRSDKGISLYVDLNSNLSSWAESLSRDVNIMESSSCKKAQTVQEEIVHFAESKLESKSTMSATTQDHKISTGNLHSGTVLRLEDNNSSSQECMGTEVPKRNEENQVHFSSRPDFNTENEICMVRTVGSAVDKLKVDSFSSLSVSMSEGARTLAMIERPSNTRIRGCYRCSFWPYGCDKCSMSGSLEMKISETTILQKTQSKTAILTSADKDGNVPKAIEESQVVFLSKPDSNIGNRISVSSFVRTAAGDSEKMDSLSRLESDGAASLVRSKGPSEVGTQGCYRCFCWSYGCETCSMSGAVNRSH